MNEGLNPTQVTIRVIAGLGNPASAGYAETRHNIGFMVVDQMQREFGSSWYVHDARSSSLVSNWRWRGEVIRLVKPQWYMNRSGEALKNVIESEGCPLESVLIIHDDLDLPPGRLRIRHGGGSGGHRGVQSVIDECGDGFTRIRIGIGHPPQGESVVDYVLSPFGPEEVMIVRDTIHRACRSAESIVSEGLIAAMNTFNKPIVEGTLPRKE